MRRPFWSRSRLAFDVECYRNDRASGVSVLPALWACATPRERLAYRINDLGSALMDLSRKIYWGCPSLDNPTMETAFSMLDHFGVTMGDVAQMAVAKRAASSSSTTTHTVSAEAFFGDPADHTPDGAAFVHLCVGDDGHTEVLLIEGTSSVPTRAALMAAVVAVS